MLAVTIVVYNGLQGKNRTSPTLRIAPCRLLDLDFRLVVRHHEIINRKKDN